MDVANRSVLLPMVLLAFLFMNDPTWAADQSVLVQTQPHRVFVEREGNSQYFVFAFELSNPCDETVTLTELRVKAYDAMGQLLISSKLDSNGGRPSIEVLGMRQLEPHKRVTVFNPFDQLTTPGVIAVLRYEFDLSGRGGQSTVKVEIKPVKYEQKTPLTVPVMGKHLWAYEAPGLYSHHSRVDLTDSFTRDVMKMRHNGQRYALDLVVLDKNSEAFHGDDNVKENWVGYGCAIVAPGSGTVVSTENTQPNEMNFDESKLADPKVMIGNFVVIDHGNGEFSAMAHFQQGSIIVKAGDRVTRGQVIAKMGRSGMGSGLIHVHYQLQDSPELFDGEALPFRFEAVRLSGESSFKRARISSGAVFDSPPFSRSLY